MNISASAYLLLGYCQDSRLPLSPKFVSLLASLSPRSAAAIDSPDDGRLGPVASFPITPVSHLALC
ncbi:MAG TPA: hypothetical protein DCF86_05145, partial [Dehalococcoidia bacterium]|nr:hypothetical protein [Dehalococcoidia bacterium]